MRHRDSGLKLVAVGVISGLIAAFAMEEAQVLMARLAPKSAGDGAPATEKAADKAALATTGHRLTKADRLRGGRGVHYGVGAGLGVIYVLLAERWRSVTTGFGGGYGAALSFVLDEGLIPALRLGPRPAQASAEQHLFGLGAHAIFGTVLEASRRALLRLV